jgi:Na+/H+ antiporter NhaD/arsenite permease-like protein
MALAGVLFLTTYILMFRLDKYKHWTALSSGLLFILFGIIPINNIFGYIDFNVLLMMAGMMGLVSLFIESKMPNLLADIIVSKSPNIMVIVVLLSLFAGIISAFVDNVATVLMIAPVALSICNKLKTNPVPVIICIAVSSNLQGAATLVGDTTAIMLGSSLGMSFMDFFIYKGKPSMFFIVELGAIASAMIVAFIFRKNRNKIEQTGEFTKVTDFVPTILLIMDIALLVGLSFIENKPAITNGLVGCVLFLIGVSYDAIRDKSIKSINEHLANIDLNTLILLSGLFIMIGGITEAGIIDLIANTLSSKGSNIFVLYTIIVFASVIVSAFIDNIPYVATMIPIIHSISVTLGIDATALYFGLLSGATLGGNITPIGASANITALGILKAAGYDVKAKEFYKIGIPFTLAAVIPAYFIIWLLFGI